MSYNLRPDLFGLNNSTMPVSHQNTAFLQNHGYKFPSAPSLSYNVASVPSTPSSLNSSVLENYAVSPQTNDVLSSLASTLGKSASSAMSGGLLGPISGAIQAGTGLLGMFDDIFDWSGKRKQAQKQFDKQVELQEKTWEREDNAVQRRAKDLEAAGLSKTLAAGSAAATSSPIQHIVPNPVEGISGGVQDALKGFGQGIYTYLAQQQLENQLKIQNASVRNSQLANINAIQIIKNQKIEEEIKEIALDKLRYSSKFIPVEYWINLLGGMITNFGSSAIKGYFSR